MSRVSIDWVPLALHLAAMGMAYLLGSMHMRRRVLAAESGGA